MGVPGFKRISSRWSHQTIKRKTEFLPHCRQRITSASCPIWNTFHGNSARLYLEARKQQEYLYFPTDSIASLLYVMRDGAIAVVGNDGVLGISLFMGAESTPGRAVVQSAGNAYRLKSSTMKKEFERGGPLQGLLLRYTQVLITQMAQTAVCNRHHTVDQQLCRWLLLSLDRLPSNELIMTHDLISDMLGVRRPGRERGRWQAAGGGIDRLQPRQDHRARPSAVGSARVRVL